MNDRKKARTCKHSVIASMSVSRCANCGMTFAGIRKKYIDELKQKDQQIKMLLNIINKNRERADSEFHKAYRKYLDLSKKEVQK